MNLIQELHAVQEEIEKNINEGRSDVEYEQLLIKREKLRRRLT
jgi:hypothetical protein